MYTKIFSSGNDCEETKNCFNFASQNERSKKVYYAIKICFVLSGVSKTITVSTKNNNLQKKEKQKKNIAQDFGKSLHSIYNASVHSYDSYESTTDCKGPTALQIRTDIF